MNFEYRAAGTQWIEAVITFAVSAFKRRLRQRHFRPRRGYPDSRRFQKARGLGNAEISLRIEVNPRRIAAVDDNECFDGVQVIAFNLKRHIRRFNAYVFHGRRRFINVQIKAGFPVFVKNQHSVIICALVNGAKHQGHGVGQIVYPERSSRVRYRGFYDVHPA